MSIPDTNVWRRTMRSRPGAGRTIVSVVGPHSGSGKTAFVIYLLKQLGGFGCLKISPAYEHPVGEGAADADTATDYHFENPEELVRPGKDTALYLAAGALHVERLRHRGRDITDGLQAALDRFPKEVAIVVESSSAALLMQPAVVMLVTRPPIREMKPATAAVLHQVTDLVIHTSDPDGCGVQEAARLRQTFPLLCPLFTWPVDTTSQQSDQGMLGRMGAALTHAKV